MSCLIWHLQWQFDLTRRGGYHCCWSTTLVLGSREDLAKLAKVAWAMDRLKEGILETGVVLITDHFSCCSEALIRGTLQVSEDAVMLE